MIETLFGNKYLTPLWELMTRTAAVHQEGCRTFWLHLPSCEPLSVSLLSLLLIYSSKLNLIGVCCLDNSRTVTPDGASNMRW